MCIVMLNSGTELTMFDYLCQFPSTAPMFKKNLPRNGPLHRNFRAQILIHMGGTYPMPSTYHVPRALYNQITFRFHCIISVAIILWLTNRPKLRLWEQQLEQQDQLITISKSRL